MKANITLMTLLCLVACGKPQSANIENPPANRQPDSQIIREREVQAFELLEREVASNFAPENVTAPPTAPIQPEQSTEPAKPASTSPRSQGILDVSPDGWVTVADQCEMTNRTRDDARKEAIANAKARAAKEVAGEVVSRSEALLRFDTKRSSNSAAPMEDFRNVFTALTETSTYAHVVGSEILAEGLREFRYEGGPPIPFYWVKLRTKVEKEIGQPDSGFRVNLNLNQETFREGEEITLKVTPTRDCYITVFNILSDDTVVRLHPDAGKAQFVKASQTFVLLSAEQRKKGSRLRVGLLPGKMEDTEAVLIIATRTDIPFLPVHAEELPRNMGVFAGKTLLPTYRTAIEELAKWLVSIPLDQRTSNLQPYEIRKR